MLRLVATCSLVFSLSALGDTMEKALELRSEGKIEPAILVLEKLLQGEKGNVSIKRELAVTLSWDGQYDRSIDIYRSLSENSDDHSIKVDMARVLLWKGKLDKVQAILTPLKHRPDALLLLAQRESILGNPKRARRLLEKIPSSSPLRDEATRFRKQIENDRRLQITNKFGGDGEDLQFSVAAQYKHSQKWTWFLNVGERNLNDVRGQNYTTTFGVSHKSGRNLLSIEAGKYNNDWGVRAGYSTKLSSLGLGISALRASGDATRLSLVLDHQVLKKLNLAVGAGSTIEGLDKYAVVRLISESKSWLVMTTASAPLEQSNWRGTLSASVAHRLNRAVSLNSEGSVLLFNPNEAVSTVLVGITIHLDI